MNDQLDVEVGAIGKSPSPVKVLGLLGLFVLSGLYGLSCGGDDLPTERERPAGLGPVGLFDGGGTDAEESFCPEQAPKVGENCPSNMDNQIRCQYVVGVCEHMNSTYDITVDYCCARGTVWEMCGTNTTPCDREGDAGASPAGTSDAGS